MTRSTDFWHALFGNEAPVEIEIGSGDGTFLAMSGGRYPARNFLGIERSPAKARRLAERMAKLDSPNVRTLRADAMCLVTSIIPSRSVAAYHVYFPDPWPKRGHANRRIFSVDFVAGLARTLIASGQVFLATDVQEYGTLARDLLLTTGAFLEVGGEGHPGLGTSFARKYRAAGRVLYTYTFIRAGASESCGSWQPRRRGRCSS